MYTVRENNIADNTVKISMRIIREFRCAEGRIGIVQHGRFEFLADGHIAKDGDIYAQRNRETSPLQQNPESSLLLTGVPVKPQQNMCGVLAWSCLRTLLAAHREAPL